ncbi:hypothetical protein EJB05_33562, partial [Eragrostis curvula]
MSSTLCSSRSVHRPLICRAPTSDSQKLHGAGRPAPHTHAPPIASQRAPATSRCNRWPLRFPASPRAPAASPHSIRRPPHSPPSSHSSSRGISSLQQTVTPFGHPGQPRSRPPAPWDCRFRCQDPYWSSICMRKCTYIICAIAFTSHVHYDAPSGNGEEWFLPRYAFKDKNDSVLTGSHNSVVEFVKLHSAVCGSKQEQHSNKTDPLPNTPADISS